LVGDLEVLKAIEALPEPGPELGTGPGEVAPDGEGGMEVQAAALGHLRRWLSMMLARVRGELYGTETGNEMKRGRTLEERTFHWDERFRRLGFVQAREEALPEVGRILAGATSTR
jgi:hypothetical protein